MKNNSKNQGEIIVFSPNCQHDRPDDISENGLSNTQALEYVQVEGLQPYPNNPRLHNKRQRRALRAAIERFGFNVPILIDADRSIIAGDLRVEIAKELGFDEIPAIRISHLTEAEIRAFIIADNRIAELGEWDNERLASEFDFLASMDFDVELTGFEAPEIDIIFADQANDDVEADAHPEPDKRTPSVSRDGDLWLFGDQHRLLCGNALDPENYRLLLGGEQARMVFTDPPYNVAIDGNVSGLGAVHHNEFAMASGEMTDAEFTEFLGTAFANMAEFSTNGSIHFACIDWRHVWHMIEAGKGVFNELKNICTWVKSNAGMGSLYRSRHEFIVVFKKGNAPHVNNVELGRHGRYRSNVWHYPGANSLSPDRQDELRMHPTVKPVAMVADAMLDCSIRSAIVLDPFVGSGTLFIAAEKSGRRGYGMELDPHYVDVAVQRWEQFTNGTVHHADTGCTFAEMKAVRLSAADAANPGTGGHHE